MGQSYPAKSMYNIYYQDLNNIGAVGCEHLSKAKWDNLTKLDLSTYLLI
jgi:hypothetical protein